MWKRLTAELGLTALAVPGESGGMGATLAEVAVAVGAGAMAWELG